MKVLIEREEFARVFAQAAAVAPARSPNPIIQNVKLLAGADKCELSATDMEISLRVAAQGVTVEKPGAVLLNVPRFGAVLKESGDETLALTATDRHLTVKGARSEVKFSVESADEFPAVSAADMPIVCHIPAQALRQMLKRTVFATDCDSTRYALGAVLLEFRTARMVAVATDGRRLAYAEASKGYEPEAVDVGKALVPTRAVKLLERLLPDDETRVALLANNNQVAFELEGVRFVARQLEGRFPKWQEVMPQPSGKYFAVAGAEFERALAQAQIVTSDESRGVDFALDGDSLRLSAQTAEVGKSDVDLPVTGSGKASYRLDGRFVRDFLKACDGAEVKCEPTGDGGPVLFSAGDGYKYVVMPLARE